MDKVSPYVRLVVALTFPRPSALSIPLTFPAPPREAAKIPDVRSDADLVVKSAKDDPVLLTNDHPMLLSLTLPIPADGDDSKNPSA